jgi:hypothetical protein
MKTRGLALALGLAGLDLAAAAGPARDPVPAAARERREATVERLIRRWPEASRLAALLMMERYGPPHMVTHKSLVWIQNAPWKGTLVYRSASRRRGVLRQFIAYRVPLRKARELAGLGIGVSADPVRDELAAEGGSEEENFLALNAADAVASGANSPAEALAFRARTLNLARSGKTSEAMRRFLFTAP